MPFGEGVRGIEDLRVALLTGDTPGANTDIVGVKQFSIDVSSDSDEQMGDDSVLMTVQENKTLEITVSSAYANLAALGVITGSTPLTQGQAGSQITTWEEPAASNTAYVQLTGQAKGRDTSGSGLRLTVLKAQLTGGPNWSLEEGAWMEPELTFTGVGRGSPAILYKVQSYETKVAIT